MAKQTVVKRKILIDEPSKQDAFHGKGHDRTADALARAITGFEGNDRAIGLDGPWGSGKSTVVEIARQKLASRQRETGVAYHFFTFDIWQSQGSSFRRSFLEHFLDWSRATFPGDDDKLVEIEHKVKGKIREVHSNNHSILDWWGVIVVVLIPILPLFYIWAKSAFDAAGEERWKFLLSGPSLAMLTFVIAPFILALMRNREELDAAWARGWTPFFAKYREDVSRTLLINAKQYEDQKVTQYIRETDPNDFEFQSTLREVLRVIQSKTSRVVLVLDNIDRLPPKELNDYWAQVRAVFANGPLVKNAAQKNPVTAIVPYDRRLIEEGTKEKGATADSSQSVVSISSLSNRERFSKTFDEILTVSPPVMSNSREFFLSNIAEALPGRAASDDLFRVFLIFDRILKSESGNATPRQIIAFINELTGMYVLHQGQFGLATVALYIAYQDALEANPSLLNNGSTIDERLRALAADNDLDRNLAAMIFNVEPDLAFQLLLDANIKHAASGGKEGLLEISKAPGFDLRVDDVVRENAREWLSSDEFGLVVANFADLAQSYEGDAKPHFSKTLVKAYDHLGGIELTKGDQIGLLRGYDLATSDATLGLTQNLLRAGFSGFGENYRSVERGGEWSEFVAAIARRLRQTGDTATLAEAMRSMPLPTDPAFMFGVAAAVVDEELSLAIFRPRKPDVSDDPTVFDNFAVSRPYGAKRAFAEFKRAKLLTDEQWLSAASALISSLSTYGESDLENYNDRISLLGDLFTYLALKQRDELAVAAMFGNVAFYSGLKASFEAGNHEGLTAALFLAMNAFEAKALPIPSTRASNGPRIQDATPEFEWFRQRFDGEVDLTDAQYAVVATLAKDAFVITSWVEAAVRAPDDHLLSAVLVSAFADGDLPSTNLELIVKHYDFLASLLGDEFRALLDRYQERISQKNIDEIALDTWPIGLLDSTAQIKGGRWEAVHEKVGQLLDQVPTDEWKSLLGGGGQHERILLEKIRTSGFEFSDPEVKDVVADFFRDILSGQVNLADNSLPYDDLMKAIDGKFHADIYRRLREEIKSVTASTLGAAAAAFPTTLSMIITAGDRLAKNEKDNLVRYILCAALEGGNRAVLRHFEGLGRSKVRDFIKSSEDSTQEKLEGAWTHFSNGTKDFGWKRDIGELLHGRKKAKSLVEIFLGSSSKDEEEEEADA
ncbi:P-loop NTPase fold protein [Rhizobium sp. R693]|uniref:P-loop NTPase fold protein n=1 Tax=Rhizobium sp. R693 TaxID=1764276 RepID=UPI000B538622|nr:P-loop NTPase fold protein [Rhizobium sp. R693]OWV82701.1 hypothetical protein ATY79_15000 [Rhizobium sp. R693]